MKQSDIEKLVSNKFYDHMDIRGGVSALVARKVFVELITQALKTQRQEIRGEEVKTELLKETLLKFQQADKTGKPWNDEQTKWWNRSMKLLDQILSLPELK